MTWQRECRAGKELRAKSEEDWGDKATGLQASALEQRVATFGDRCSSRLQDEEDASTERTPGEERKRRSQARYSLGLKRECARSRGTRWQCDHHDGEMSDVMSMSGFFCEGCRGWLLADS